MRQTEPGWALQRLLDVHATIRSDLASLRRAVDALTEDRPATEAARQLGELSFRQPGWWALRRFCAEFCGFIHEHHSVENAVVFPTVLEFAGDRPEVRAAVQRLRAEHERLSAYVDDAERALAALPGDAAAKATAVSAMAALYEHLEVHLAYEEESLAAVLNDLSSHVTPEEVGAPEPPRR
jgi:alcohol dehydrogenase class IV